MANFIKKIFYGNINTLGVDSHVLGIISCRQTTKFMKQLFIFMAIASVSCNPVKDPLNEKEKEIVGNWMKPLNNGQARGFYMEFHENRTGVFGPVITTDNKLGMIPYMSLLMKDWRIQNDTLSIELGMQSGLVAYGPDGEEIKQNEKPSYAHFVVWELSDTVIVLEDLVGEFPSKDRLEKSDKIGTID